MATCRRTATNENVNTYGDATRDYTAFSTWEAATDIDLVTAAQSEVLECYDDATSFDDYVYMLSANTDADYFRIVRPADGQEHDGTPNNGFNIHNTSDNIVFQVAEDYAQIQDIVIKSIISDTSVANRIVISTNRPNVVIAGCIVYDCYHAGSGRNMYGFVKSGGDDTCFIDCLADNIQAAGAGVGRGFYNTNADSVLMYNCTAVDCKTHGIRDISAVLIAKNCCSSGNGTDWDGTITKTTCTAEGTTPTYKDSANNDFHLATSDPVCRAKGTDLSSDAAFAFDDDIDGVTITNWCIGFDEYTESTARRTAVNENISTYGNATRDYTAFGTWEAVADIDLVTAAQSEVLECYDDATSFDDHASMAGATTSSDYFRIIRPALGQGHDGTPNNGFNIANTSDNTVFRIAEDYAQIQDIVVKTIILPLGSQTNIVYCSGDHIKIIGCIIYDSISYVNNLRGFMTNTIDVSFIDCACINIQSVTDTSYCFYLQNATNAYIYNCTAVNSDYGLRQSGSSVIAKNCCVSGNGIDWAGSFTKTTCTAEGASPIYKNAAGNNFHLAASDTVCRDNGTDLSADAIFSFDDDIDGEKWGATWDIGFDKFSAASSGRSRWILKYLKSRRKI